MPKKSKTMKKMKSSPKMKRPAKVKGNRGNMKAQKGYS